MNIFSAAIWYSFAYIVKILLETIKGYTMPNYIIHIGFVLIIVILNIWLNLYLKQRIKNKIKLRPKFGVLWDRNKEPYCPICENPLARYKVRLSGKTETGFNCANCDKRFSLITDEGKRITVIEAKKLL